MAAKGSKSPDSERKVPENSRIAAVCFAALAIATGPTQAATPEIHYAPAENLERIDVGQLRAAKRTIDMTAYVLTDWAVIDALVAAGRRGVAVRVYLDGEQAGRADMEKGHPFATLMATPGVSLKNKKADAPLMHLKSYCVDGAVLRTGSANFSASGLKQQDNDLLLLAGPGVCEGFDAAFRRAWTGPDAE